jgi:stalled ribosome alternative rescue factor ArfA
MRTTKRNFTKKRDPTWKTRRTLGHRIVPAKKGRGSYKRKEKHNEYRRS